MKIKVLIAAVASAALGLFASSANADTYVGNVTLSLTSGMQYGSGGQFTASLPVTPAGAADLNEPASGTPLTFNFQTFCIEAGAHDVTFNPGGTYSAYLVSVPQATAAGSTLANPGTWLVPTSITKALYGAFVAGHLSGYTNATSAGELQYAIWIAQGDAGSAYSSPASLAAFQADVNYMSSTYGYAGLTASEEIVAYNWYHLADTGGYGTDGQYVATLALGNPVGPNGTYGNVQAQLVEVTPTGSNVVTGTPLPRSAYAGLSLLVGLGGFELLRKRQGSKPQLA